MPVWHKAHTLRRPMGPSRGCPALRRLPWHDIPTAAAGGPAPRFRGDRALRLRGGPGPKAPGCRSAPAPAAALAALSSLPQHLRPARPRHPRPPRSLTPRPGKAAVLPSEPGVPFPPLPAARPLRLRSPSASWCPRRPGSSPWPVSRAPAASPRRSPACAQNGGRAGESGAGPRPPLRAVGGWMEGPRLAERECPA